MGQFCNSGVGCSEPFEQCLSEWHLIAIIRWLSAYDGKSHCEVGRGQRSQTQQQGASLVALEQVKGATCYATDGSRNHQFFQNWLLGLDLDRVNLLLLFLGFGGGSLAHLQFLREIFLFLLNCRKRYFWENFWLVSWHCSCSFLNRFLGGCLNYRLWNYFDSSLCRLCLNNNFSWVFRDFLFDVLLDGYNYWHWLHLFNDNRLNADGYALKLLLSLSWIELNDLLFHFSLNHSLIFLHHSVLWYDYLVLNHHCFRLENHSHRLLGNYAVELFRRRWSVGQGVIIDKDFHRLTDKDCLGCFHQERSWIAENWLIFVLLSDYLVNWIQCIDKRHSFLFLRSRSWALHWVIEVRKRKRLPHGYFLDFIRPFDL